MKLMTLALLTLSLQFSSCSYMGKKQCSGESCKVSKECNSETCKMNKTGEKEKKSCCSGKAKS